MRSRPSGVRRTSEACWRVGVREGGWPAAFALAFRGPYHQKPGEEEVSLLFLAAFQGTGQGQWAGADVVTETQ